MQIVIFCSHLVFKAKKPFLYQTRSTKMTEGTNLSIPEQNPVLTEVKKYHLFPNPAKGEFTVEYSILQEKRSQFLQIRDLNGKLIKEIQLDDSGQRIIQTHEFLPGIYFLSIRTSKTIEWQEKLIIIK